MNPSGAQYQIAHDEMRATVVEVGGGLRSLVVGDREVLDGYGVNEMCPDGRGQVLVPWPNRIDHGRYEWDGRLHQTPLSEPENANAIHGLVRFSRWDCVASEPARVELAHTLWPSPGYPFTLELRITYTVDGDGLQVRTSAHNAGVDPLPVRCRSAPLPPHGCGRDRRLVFAIGSGTAVPAGRRAWAASG